MIKIFLKIYTIILSKEDKLRKIVVTESLNKLI